ncbi:MAG: CRISPR-associated endonuclease Cas2 [Myxococcota bacterium]
MSKRHGSHWHLVTYDIRDAGRWRKAYRLLRGHGERLQYSVFRVRASDQQLERLRWELERILDSEDDLLILSLCPSCGRRVKERNSEDAWRDEPPVRFTE